MFYTYVQNNSYGVFDVDDNVKHYVIIEADSAKEADKKARNLGIYFNGVENDIDCPCCGDRWDKADDPDFGINGTEKPEIYGQSVLEFIKEREKWIWKEEAIVYYKDGKVEVFSALTSTSKKLTEVVK